MNTASTKLTKTEALEILGLTESANDEDIKTAYKKLSKSLHPDLHGSKYLFQLVNNAYQTLSVKKNDETENNTHTQTETKQTTITKSDVINAKDFKLPFDTLLRAAASGGEYIVYKNVRVMITALDLHTLFIRSEIPGLVRCKLYKSLYNYLIDKPDEDIKHHVSLGNKFPFTTNFGRRITVRQHGLCAKYYRIEFNLPSVHKSYKFQGRTKSLNPENPKCIKDYVCEPIYMNIKASFEIEE